MKAPNLAGLLTVLTTALTISPVAAKIDVARSGRDKQGTPRR